MKQVIRIDRIQNGLDPDDWKPLAIVGKGVREIRVRVGGAFRVIYVANFNEAIVVLHCFQKKTQRTSRTDIDIAVRRYRDLLRERRR